MLAAALFETLGIRARFVIVAGDPDRPNDFTHVFLEYKGPAGWQPFDTTDQRHDFGQLAGRSFANRRTIPVNDMAQLQGMNGQGGLGGAQDLSQTQGSSIDWNEIITTGIETVGQTAQVIFGPDGQVATIPPHQQPPPGWSQDLPDELPAGVTRSRGPSDSSMILAGGALAALAGGAIWYFAMRED
jgi:hypothetical protein